MLCEFSIVPIGVGSSIGDYVAKVLKIIDGSSMPYKLNPMGTVVEGDMDKVFELIKKCHNEVLKNSERVLTSITIDDRKGAVDSINRKVAAIEKRVGKELKK